MQTVLFRLPIIFSILTTLGCAVSLTSTPVSMATETATEASVLAIEIEDLPDVQSLSLTVAADRTLYMIQGREHSLFISRSTDGGRTFGEPVLGTGHVPVHVLPIERPAIATAGNGQVAIAWLEMPPDFQGANIWYAFSEDHGQTFAPGRLVASEPEGEVAMVEIVLDAAGNPFLAWLNESELKFSRSHDGGATFTEPASIGEGACECCQPQVVILDQSVHIAYRSLEPGNEKGDIRDIVMINSPDAGETFAPVSRVSDTHWYLPACPIAGPSLAIYDEKFYAAWMDGRHEPAGVFSRGDIWLASSGDRGSTFSPNVRINPDQEMHHTLPSIAIGPGGRIHIAWEAQARETRDAFLYYTTSDDGGQSFAPLRVITDNTDGTRGNPSRPVLVVNQAGNVTLTWLDRQGGRLATWVDTK
ncbi:MAG: glycoside hydrolase [Chloroflexota bacterium]|nr:glycoside hydrolase [Chloroflexota bacterium]